MDRGGVASQEPPGPPPLLRAVRELGAALDAFDDAAASELGLGRSDLRALNALEDGPQPTGLLAQRLALSSGAVTALVDRLQEAGYVVRRSDPTDGRRVLVELHPRTWSAFARVYAPCGRAVAQVGEQVGDATVATTREVLAAVSEAVREQERALRT